MPSHLWPYIVKDFLLLNGQRPKRRTAVSLGGRSSGSSEKAPRSRSVCLAPDRARVRGRSPAFNLLAATFESPKDRNLSTPPPINRKPFPKSYSSDSATVSQKSAAIAALTSTFEQSRSALENLPRSRKGMLRMSLLKVLLLRIADI